MATSMLARRWKARATALPVSPEVATRITAFRPSPASSSSMAAAWKQAPKSLKAQVGPWNSSSSRRPGVSGLRTGSKSKAAAHDARRPPPSPAPRRSRASHDGPGCLEEGGAGGQASEHRAKVRLLHGVVQAAVRGQAAEQGFAEGNRGPGARGDARRSELHLRLPTPAPGTPARPG